MVLESIYISVNIIHNVLLTTSCLHEECSHNTFQPLTLQIQWCKKLSSQFWPIPRWSNIWYKSSNLAMYWHRQLSCHQKISWTGWSHTYCNCWDRNSTWRREYDHTRIRTGNPFRNCSHQQWQFLDVILWELERSNPILSYFFWLKIDMHW